jgi:large repetitive protein
VGASVSGTVKVKILKEVHITTTTLRSGKVNKSYKVKLRVSGGQAPYSWVRMTGVFPAGLSLDGVTGVIAGVPTVTGNFPLTFQVTDDLGGVDPQDLTLEIK